MWAVKKIKAVEAWSIAPTPGGKSKGAGVSIFQPDTGVTDHSELLGAVEQTQSHDFVDNRAGATDPMNYDGNPGHGTGTASVAAGRGASGKMSGSAPGATLVPLRAIKKVVVFDHGRVAAAVEYARQKGADVITMSLGGAWSTALRAAINSAIKDGVIVLAAAGNCVGWVVYPARYEEVIAVAAINKDDKSWKGTCSGDLVDISAPGEFVPRANAARVNGGSPVDVRGGQGTSFAVALTAGVAALWLGHHGKATIRAALAPGQTIQDKFVALLQATAHRPSDWDRSLYGAGIVDAERLLGTPLSHAPGEAELVAGDVADDGLESLRTLLAETAPARAEMVAEIATPAIVTHRFAAEISHLAMARAKPDTGTEAEGTQDVLSPSETLMRAGQTIPA